MNRSETGYLGGRDLDGLAYSSAVRVRQMLAVCHRCEDRPLTHHLRPTRTHLPSYTAAKAARGQGKTAGYGGDVLG
jgi:hypothetical protein